MRVPRPRGARNRRVCRLCELPEEFKLRLRRVYWAAGGERAAKNALAGATGYTPREIGRHFGGCEMEDPDTELANIVDELKLLECQLIQVANEGYEEAHARLEVLARVGELENDKLAELKDQLAALSKKQDTRATLTIRANEACGRMKMQRAALVAKIKDRRLHAEEHGQALPGGEGTDRLLELVDDVAASGQMQ